MINAKPLLAQLPYAHWTVELEFKQRAELEPYKGNVLHGGFGRALAMVSQQLFNQLFVQPADNNQWVTPFALFSHNQQQHFAEGSVLQFELILLGPAAAAQQAVLDCLMVWQVLGLGARHARFQVRSVTDNQGALLYQAGRPQLAVLPAYSLAHFMATDVSAIAASCNAVGQALGYRLSTLTRCRLQHKGKPLHQAPALSLWCRIVKRRFWQLVPDDMRQASGQMQPEQPPEKVADQLADQPQQTQVHFHDWQRFSAKEQRQVPMGGLEGQWLYPQVTAEQYFWLQLGELIGVGNKSSFGFGRYRGELVIAAMADRHSAEHQSADHQRAASA
ncbi:CRISPR system precrRNA processing endoribonuclease RAMP protein Cas6 [Rheinheimera sediminis]|uniref:CRISPR system precrRNA processing endoribonuclease RAMP protein Cas6 n=1 Tax=Rheinheimera sp. YQF-1 TaxID=2499626 RepID=UPI000FDAB7C9|nr:CRISPR system precrRNA processing endoribonuclease RAMP protein Cas6 [Rheinheimera sp. YQF-1]RVT47830.1 CRISPR system precrRNA processing endoribonuclease RAMP protein Cas6 [Rheinheimera sp. YQF-1]